MLDCIVRTVMEEGVLSLWRGNGSSVIRYYPSVALNFSLKLRICTGISYTATFKMVTFCLGLPASLHGMIVHRGLYFGGFDTIKDGMAENSEAEVPLWKRWVVAQAVTTSAGLLSYPLDTVRRRMRMQSALEKPMYRSTLDCWRRIYKTEGFTSFYRGAMSNIFRSTGAAAVLVLYDEVKKFMNWSGL
ncbi:hypothetical protein K7X08_005074 [Anisodus acutangulus]|uniref:ADP/ATP translocase n=1 Tax=Anisodus acutangulus TaxID=402998 RepID=A0A9Q1MF01_9SOLA|nr:hypothetical protein K7X08_005074 [Anisodus acutangulus]